MSTIFSSCLDYNHNSLTAFHQAAASAAVVHTFQVAYHHPSEAAPWAITLVAKVAELEHWLPLVVALATLLGMLIQQERSCEDCTVVEAFVAITSWVRSCVDCSFAEASFVVAACPSLVTLLVSREQYHSLS